ncbi:Ribonuclease H [Quillaja saponaria]|uniref:Ribonuclease H n=1 Tax=Quillaja saponaria TaxID=32244 RepID=A0AAD7LA72_QUISA|nr:Ribonuclease H [Quillaja saponaria]
MIPRVKYFLWLLCQNRILTNFVRWTRKCASDPSCTLYGASVDDELHAIRDCLHASHIWFAVIPVQLRNSFFSSSWLVWINTNLKSNCYGLSGAIPWPPMFSFVAWRIWNWINKLLFEDGFVIPPNPIVVVSSDLYALWKSLSLDGQLTTKIEKWISWTPPLSEWVKINTDGCSKSNGSVAGCEALIRGNLGEWITGFAANLGHGSNNFAELYGLFYGLRSAWSLQFKKVITEVDSEVIIELVKGDTSDFHLI